jgi:hypothetical protein
MNPISVRERMIPQIPIVGILLVIPVAKSHVTIPKKKPHSVADFIRFQ